MSVKVIHGPAVIHGPIIAQVRPKRHIGRNDPCWCGSGKKFKRCCLGRTVSIPHAIVQGISRRGAEHAEGLSSEARACD